MRDLYRLLFILGKHKARGQQIPGYGKRSQRRKRAKAVAECKSLNAQ